MIDPEIPGFTLGERIGKGGMASVYLAVDEMGRQVALKVIDGAQANAAAVFEQFTQEAGIIGRLRHPNIVRIYRAGQHEQWYFLVSEYLPGGDLKARIRAGIAVDDALELTRKLTGALDVAHEANLVHRDVKPENVLFRANDVPVLMDFGIAAASGLEHGVMAGTPLYMSPEQVNSLAVDRRTDIYSLGCVLFEMLTGAPPYPLATMEAILYAQVHKPVPALPPRLAELQGLIDAMMCKNVVERIGSGKELLRLLDEYWLLAPRAGSAGPTRAMRPVEEESPAPGAHRAVEPARAEAPAAWDAAVVAAQNATAVWMLEQAHKAALEKRLGADAEHAEQAAAALPEDPWNASYELARDYLTQGEFVKGTELLNMIAAAAPGEVANIAREMLDQLSR